MKKFFILLSVIVTLLVSCSMFTVDVRDFFDNIQENANIGTSTPTLPTVSVPMIAIPGGKYKFQEAYEKSVEPFYLGETEVTQAQWESVMGSTWPGSGEIDIASSHTADKSKQPNSTYGKGAAYPAYYVIWYDAIRFCNALSDKEGLQRVYTKSDGTAIDVTDNTFADADLLVVPNANGYRLPTEVEWEYAAGHGGFQTDGITPNARTTYSGTNNEADLVDYAWYSTNAGETSHIVGTAGSLESTPTAKSGNKNTLGLYDMSGNVLELSCDTVSYVNLNRISRGGYWDGDAFNCLVTMINSANPTLRSRYMGFRVARSK